jgi:AraC-like DNA-binding protein
MNQFLFEQKKSTELDAFPHLLELGVKKINTVQLNSFKKESKDSIRFYYIIEGRHEWLIDDKPYLLFPGDLAILLPNQSFGGTKELLEVGTICWMHLKVEKSNGRDKIDLGKWTRINDNEKKTMASILQLNATPVLSRIKEAGDALLSIHYELVTQEIGFTTRVNHLLDYLLIIIVRQLSKQNNSRRDFPETFMKLEQSLRANLSHQWTVEEMAAMVGLGTTAFTEKVKKYTGFSPLTYLINIRISEAIRLLKQEQVNLTDIALDVGFYSSQHFSTTFKKLTGYTPSQFRKNNSFNT